jgi:hypothetical protein
MAATLFLRLRVEAKPVPNVQTLDSHEFVVGDVYGRRIKAQPGERLCCPAAQRDRKTVSVER